MEENTPKHLPYQPGLVPTSSAPILSLRRSPVPQSPCENAGIFPGTGGRSADWNGVGLFGCQLRIQEIVARAFGMGAGRWGGSCNCFHTGELWGGKSNNKRHLFAANKVSQKISGNRCELQVDHCFASPLQISHKNISCGHSDGTRAGKGTLGNAVLPHQADTYQASLPGQLLPHPADFP